ncbi:unnamed protein product [Prunus armeniaca]|uniref:peroxidase n=1 Tax=Prunus armeniaca TaxID=36596 RepID=A0A6J5VN73_PRUAR|nr:unnamed protein product [Prunus armeniaca]
MSFGMRNFRYIEEIKEALERECPGAVSCSDILVLSAREGVVRDFRLPLEQNIIKWTNFGVIPVGGRT